MLKVMGKWTSRREKYFHAILKNHTIPYKYKIFLYLKVWGGKKTEKAVL